MLTAIYAFLSTLLPCIIKHNEKKSKHISQLRFYKLVQKNCKEKRLPLQYSDLQSTDMHIVKRITEIIFSHTFKLYFLNTYKSLNHSLHLSAIYTTNKAWGNCFKWNCIFYQQFFWGTEMKVYIHSDLIWEREKRVLVKKYTIFHCKNKTKPNIHCIHNHL